MEQALFSQAGNLILLRAGLAIGVAMAGALAAVLLGSVGHRPRCALISLGAGALLGVGGGAVLPETSALIGLPRALGALAIGGLLFFLIGKYLYFTCPACSATATDREKGFVRLGGLLIAAGAFHALMDGMAITLGAEISSKVGLSVLAAVAVHKAPEGIALGSLSLQAGYGRGGALLVTLLVEIMTAMGSGLGLLAGKIPPAWLGIALGIAGGSFLYIGLFALAAEMREHEKRSIIAWSALGCGGLLILFRLLPG